MALEENKKWHTVDHNIKTNLLEKEPKNSSLERAGAVMDVLSTNAAALFERIYDRVKEQLTLGGAKMSRGHDMMGNTAEPHYKNDFGLRKEQKDIIIDGKEDFSRLYDYLKIRYDMAHDLIIEMDNGYPDSEIVPEKIDELIGIMAKLEDIEVGDNFKSGIEKINSDLEKLWESLRNKKYALDNNKD